MTTDKGLIDVIYRKYKKYVNMSYSELKRWSENPLSKKASLNRNPIKRNLKLLSKKKSDWNLYDAEEANKTISFISRMKKVKKGKKIDGKLSKRDISLLNWAYDTNK